jgi:hypothetical protein
MVDLDRRRAQAPGLGEHVLDARRIHLELDGFAET